MKTFQAFLSALLLVASTSVGALGYDPEAFPGKGDKKDYEKSLRYARKGFKQMHERNLSEALDNYDKAIQIYPYDAAVRTNRGTVLSRLGDHQRSIEEYKMAIQLEPTYSTPVNNLADEFRVLKDYKNAEAYVKKAIALQPNNPVPVVTLGEIYIETKRFSEAKKQLLKAGKLAPGMPSKEAAVKEALKADWAQIPAGTK